ncbi:MAG: hypothetical protein HC860_08245 [Alkalinema sp. RU_4_3]|nr:hypothetical protein [Alkalinema sp. RU_4_3]
MQNTDLKIVPETQTETFPKNLDIATVMVYGLAILSGGVFLFLPLVNLIHPSPWQRSLGMIHGFGAMAATIVTVYAGHLAFPLLRGSNKVLPQMRSLTFWSAVVTFLSIASGNFGYMRYRAGADFGGARAWLKDNSPLTQYVFMEYHEFSVLFTLPLAVGSAWVLWHYGDKILEKANRPILAGVSIAVMAIMFYAMGGFVTGLAIAKVHSL